MEGKAMSNFMKNAENQIFFFEVCRFVPVVFFISTQFGQKGTSANRNSLKHQLRAKGTLSFCTLQSRGQREKPVYIINDGNKYHLLTYKADGRQHEGRTGVQQHRRVINTVPGDINYTENRTGLFLLIIQKPTEMEQDDYRETEHQKAIYTKTTLKKKQQLIDLVLNKHLTIYKASKMLKISNSTAKSVIVNYNKYGVILNRNTSIQFQKVKGERGSGQQSSSTVKVQDYNDSDASSPMTWSQADRLRILTNMGIKTMDQPIAVNMPFYNYPL